jgi:hypothetical protein
MKKLGIFASLAAIVTAVALAMVSSAPASADGTACVRKDFKTELVKSACEKGGQKAAKDAMKTWLKQHPKLGTSCNKCHSKLSPTYDLKPDGLKLFQENGGK